MREEKDAKKELWTPWEAEVTPRVGRAGVPRGSRREHREAQGSRTVTECTWQGMYPAFSDVRSGGEVFGLSMG